MSVESRQSQDALRSMSGPSCPACSIQSQCICSCGLCLLRLKGHSVHLLLCVTEAFLCCLLWMRLAQHCIWLWVPAVHQSQQLS